MHHLNIVVPHWYRCDTCPGNVSNLRKLWRRSTWSNVLLDLKIPVGRCAECLSFLTGLELSRWKNKNTFPKYNADEEIWLPAIPRFYGKDSFGFLTRPHTVMIKQFWECHPDYWEKWNHLDSKDI